MTLLKRRMNYDCCMVIVPRQGKQSNLVEGHALVHFQYDGNQVTLRDSEWARRLIWGGFKRNQFAALENITTIKSLAKAITTSARL